MFICSKIIYKPWLHLGSILLIKKICNIIIFPNKAREVYYSCVSLIHPQMSDINHQTTKKKIQLLSDSTFGYEVIIILLAAYEDNDCF